MNRDPLHQKIVQALAGSLDGNTFERCAQDLLGDAYPNLAPVVGGSDSGMDGAFGTADGAFPLVCTVREDVIGNFRTNLEAYLAEKQGPRRVVVATSQALTTAKRQNLEEEAAKLGVTIVNIHDAAYFADRLYRHAAWRLQLLGITGNPPALSTFPRVGRFVRPEILIGRDQDLEWLQQTQGDLLLVGHPGSGKTYLHQHLAAQGLCLFAVDPSRQRLAEAIREQQPSIVVVDDAHIHIALVEELMQLRAELGASFQIHANCWPLHMVGVQKLLRVPTTSVRTLQPLRRQEVLDLIKKSGIAGPDWLLHTLIQQSDGKPGLAMALIESCKTEDISRIWSGEAATEQLVGNLRLVRGEKDRCVLAAFAVGGDIGMSFRDVSGTLNVPELELKQVTADLGSGGLRHPVPYPHTAAGCARVQDGQCRAADPGIDVVLDDALVTVVGRLADRRSSCILDPALQQRGEPHPAGLDERAVHSRRLHFAQFLGDLFLAEAEDRLADAFAAGRVAGTIGGTPGAVGPLLG
jgi:hypothetical protein